MFETRCAGAAFRTRCWCRAVRCDEHIARSVQRAEMGGPGDAAERLRRRLPVPGGPGVRARIGALVAIQPLPRHRL